MSCSLVTGSYRDVAHLVNEISATQSTTRSENVECSSMFPLDRMVADNENDESDG